MIELSHGLIKLLGITCALRKSPVPGSASQWQCCSEEPSDNFPPRLTNTFPKTCQALWDELPRCVGWNLNSMNTASPGWAALWSSFTLVLFVKLFRWEAEKKSVSKVDIKFKLLLSHFSVFLDHYSYSDDIILNNHSSKVTKAVFKEQNKPFYFPQTNITKC